MKTNLNANPNPLTLSEDGLPNGVYASFVTTDITGKKAMYNAINGDSGSLADNEGKELKMSDVVLARVTLTDDNGEVKDAARTVIICEDGNRFVSSSFGILRSVCAIYDVFGTLHFDDALTIMVKKAKTKKGHTYKLDIK